MESDLPYEGLGKFADPLDEVLYGISVDGWANASSGSVEAPTGFFARISNTPEELQEVTEAFDQEIERVGLRETARLVGHFLLREDDQGFVTVQSYETQAELIEEYEVLDELYGDWLGDDE
jgi:hypothetical protein